MWIQNRNTAQTVKWEAWQYQRELLEIFLKYNDIVILKARQLGISWLVSLYCLWKVLFYDNAKVLFLSQGENEAWDMVGKCRFSWEMLPPFLKLGEGRDNRGWLSFASSHSELRALPSTDKAGRGTDATIVVRDELAKHPYGKENFISIGPTIDAGGQSIDLSTIDKLDPNNHFTERVKRALNGAQKTVLPSGLELYTGGESGATLVFLSWKLRPVRDEGLTLDEWFELKVKSKYDPFQIEQEYPETLDEALRPSATKAFFSPEALDDMLLQVSQPLQNFREFDTYNGIVRVYKPPIGGRQYVIFTDPSNGIVDPFATVVMDARTGEGVCTATGNMPAQEVGRIHDMLVRAYNNAYNTGEVNAMAGGSFIDTLTALGTPNIVPRRDPQGKIVPQKIGWFSTNPLRDKALHELKEAVRKQLITMHDRDAIEQFRFFALQEDGKIRAPSGEHDDWPVAWAGAWLISRYVPLSNIQITSTKYIRG